jgi:hypothetical protein
LWRASSTRPLPARFSQTGSRGKAVVAPLQNGLPSPALAAAAGPGRLQVFDDLAHHPLLLAVAREVPGQAPV